MINLHELGEELDETLNKETEESLTNWLSKKRDRMNKITQVSTIKDVQDMIGSEGAFWDDESSEMCFGELAMIGVFKDIIAYMERGGIAYDNFKKITKQEFEAL